MLTAKKRLWFVLFEIETYLEELIDEFPETELYERSCTDETLEKIPEPLREFYMLCGGADFPFGHIFPPEEALNDPLSKQAFGDEWFQFGCDEYFTFWLCRFEPDGEGMWFDAWDHDSETDPEPAFADLRSFLEFLAKEYEDAAW